MSFFRQTSPDSYRDELTSLQYQDKLRKREFYMGFNKFAKQILKQKTYITYMV